MSELELYKSRRKTARIAGAYYFVLALAFLPDMLRKSLFVAGDAVTTGTNILANILAFRMSIFGDLIAETAFLFVALYLYSLLKDVRRDAARAMVILVVAAVPTAMLNTGNELAALALFQGGDPSRAKLFLDLYQNGALISTVFFALWLVPLGWLFFKSGFMPKTLGILLIVGSFFYLAKSFTGLVLPDWRALAEKGVPIVGLTELATVVWLLAFGVKRPSKDGLSSAPA